MLEKNNLNFNEEFFNENWKDIEGYEGIYQVSNWGRVKSLGNEFTRKEKILKPGKDSGGYPFVNLYKEGRKKMFTVHRLTAKAFLENPNNYKEVNHKDENKENNRVENLEWCSRSYNINHGSRNERVGKALSKQVGQYDKQGNLIKIFPSVIQVERELGFLNQTISYSCKNKLKSSKGYIWRYI